MIICHTHGRASNKTEADRRVRLASAQSEVQRSFNSTTPLWAWRGYFEQSTPRQIFRKMLSRISTHRFRNNYHFVPLANNYHKLLNIMKCYLKMMGCSIVMRDLVLGTNNNKSSQAQKQINFERCKLRKCVWTQICIH